MPETSTPTIYQLAGEALYHFETRYRGEERGDEYVTLKSDSPAWVQDLVREAHGRDADGSLSMLPDDWRYATTAAALEWVSDRPFDEVDELAHEFADDAVDAYTSDRFAWLASNLTRAGYCDDAAEELGAVDLGIVERVGLGQAAEAREVFGLVLDGLRERLDSLCDQCGAPTDDGEGYDGLCGNCADRAEGEGRWA